MQTGFLVEARRKGNEANHEALRESFAALKAENVPQVYYLEGANLLGDDGEYGGRFAPYGPGVHEAGVRVGARTATADEVECSSNCFGFRLTGARQARRACDDTP